MRLLRVVNQFEDGKITKGVIKLKDNTTALSAVMSWVSTCHNAGVYIAHVQYSPSEVYHNSGIWKTECFIDLRAY